MAIVSLAFGIAIVLLRYNKQDSNFKPVSYI
jgi:hypothetical protein